MTTSPYPLAARQGRCSTVVAIGNVKVGGEALVVIAGPCAVESTDQLFETAGAVQAAGAQILRGGAFKPRTSPYSFQGLGVEALAALAEVGHELDLPVITEAVDERTLELVLNYADAVQIGARSMQNFALLRAAGRCAKPVMIKRHPGATLDEWLLAAEYVLEAGNPNVILCERGVRAAACAPELTLDLAGALRLRALTHLPVVADPSHAAGDAQLVAPLAKAAAAAGVAGLMIEVHTHPQRALSDGHQALTPKAFADLMSDLQVAAAQRTPA